MRPAPPAVKALLDAARPGPNGPGVPHVSADCFTFQFVFGALKAYYTNAQQSLTVLPIDGTIPAVTFLANSVKVSGARLKLKIGVSVDEQDLRIDTTPDQLLDGVPWPQAARYGFFDGCIIRRDRFFAQDWNNGPGGQTNWVGGVPFFLGRMGTANSIGRQSIQMKVKSLLVLGDIQMPQELQQPGCRNNLYDANCGVVQASFTTAGVCGAGSNASIINWSGASAQYTAGIIQMVTGANAGVQRTIRQGTGSQLILRNPLQFEPGAGDAFEAAFGCDKTATTCDAVFANNLVGPHGFRGNRFQPPTETAV